jgi:hypothetical protein
MSDCCEYHEGKLVESYDLAPAECQICGGQVVGLFKHGLLVKTEPCSFCRVYEERDVGGLDTGTS